MTRTDTSKYPTPRDPKDDRGYGPSWRDVSEAMQALNKLTGHQHFFEQWVGGKPGVPAHGLQFQIHCHFKECVLKTSGAWLQLHVNFPNPLFKTAPAAQLDVLTRAVDAAEGYWSQQKLPLFSGES